MKKRFTEDQLIGFPKKAEVGMPVTELCRKLTILPTLGLAAILYRPQRTDGKGTPGSYPPDCPESCPHGLGCVRDAPDKPARCWHAAVRREIQLCKIQIILQTNDIGGVEVDRYRLGAFDDEYHILR